MAYKPRYEKGDWKANCDSCDRIFKASDLKKRWDGLRVCPDDFEERPAQDFVRGKPDIQIPPWVRPEQADYFLGGTNASAWGWSWGWNWGNSWGTVG